MSLQTAERPRNRTMAKQGKQRTTSVRVRIEVAELLRQVASDLSVIREEQLSVTDVVDEFLREPLVALAAKTRQQLADYIDRERQQSAKKR